MLDLSPGLTFVWQIAAQEAAYAKHQFIEKEHLFIAFCKVSDLLKPVVLQEIEARVDIEVFKQELEQLEALFDKVSLYRKKLRRSLRAILGQGNFQREEKVFHRSEDCKRFFEKASKSALQRKSSETNLFHILIAILEDPGKQISKALSDCGIKIPDLKTAAEDLSRKVFAPVGAEGRIDRKRGGDEQITKNPFLDRYGRDLTKLAREGRLGPILERRDETLQVIRTLTKKTKNNPLLIGEPGVGKTAIVEGLALRVAKGNITPLLSNTRIIELNLGLLIAGTKYRGEFEERVNRIISEASSNPDIILFIDEIHSLVGAGRAEGAAMNAADIMKPALSRGEIVSIGATTISEYRKYIEKDSALERRFQPIIIKEPSPEESIKILDRLKESWKEIFIEPSALRAAVELSVKYVPARRLPDKARDILEEACTRVKVPQLSVYGDEAKRSSGVVTAEAVAQVVSELTGIPIARLTEEGKVRFLKMAEIIKKRVIGQDDAVEKVTQVVKIQMVGLKDNRRPVGVFLFLGPTGVGKTELAKALAEFLFGSEDEIIRLDMSEYKEKHMVSRLIGAPPGYIGHDEEGQLTGRLLSKPYAIVLLDEIEKAHPEAFDLFLQLFDEGRLTDSKSRTVDARNAIFIMTSNMGSEFYNKGPLGFVHPENENGRTIKEDIFSNLSKTFRIEFLNRIDEIIFFNPLSQNSLNVIALNLLDELREKLENKGIHFDIEDRVLELIIKEGYDPAMGARPLKRAIERLIVQPLSEKLLTNEFTGEDLITVDADEDKIVFKKKQL